MGESGLLIILHTYTQLLENCFQEKLLPLTSKKNTRLIIEIKWLVPIEQILFLRNSLNNIIALIFASNIDFCESVRRHFPTSYPSSYLVTFLLLFSSGALLKLGLNGELAPASHGSMY